MKPVTGAEQQQAVLQAGKKQCGYDDCISVRILVECPHGHVGDVMNKSSSVARSLAERKIAEYVFPYESKIANHVQQPTTPKSESLVSLLRTNGTLEP